MEVEAVLEHLNQQNELVEQRAVVENEVEMLEKNVLEHLVQQNCWKNSERTLVDL